MKKLLLLILLPILSLTLLAGCVEGDPLPEDLYTTNIYPGGASTYSLGSEELPWESIYSDNIYNSENINTENLIVGGNTTLYDQILLIDDGKVWIEFRPDLDFTSVRAHGVPNWVNRGLFGAFSLPVYAADNEELYFDMCIPNRWYQPAWQELGNVGDEPGGMAEYDDKLYIPCENDDNVWVYDGTDFSISGNVGDRPRYSCVYGGNLYVTCRGDDTVWVFDGTSWALSGNVGDAPEGMAVYDGDLYVACQGNDEIWRLSGGVWAVDPALGLGGVAGAVGASPSFMASYGGDLYVGCCGVDDDVWRRNAGSWAKDADVGGDPQEFHVHDADLYLNCYTDDTIWKRSGGAWAICTNIQTTQGNEPVGLEEYGGELFSACQGSIWSDIEDFWNQNSDYNQVTTDEPMFLKEYDDKLYCSCKDGDSIWVYEGETAYIHIHCWLTAAQAAATDAFRLHVEYENFTPGTDVVPNTGDDIIIETLTGVAAQYQSYLVMMPLDMTGVDNDDNMALLLRRIASSDEIAGEIAVNHFGLIFMCDKLGDADPL